SGVGLVEIYEFLHSQGLYSNNAESHKAIINADDSAALISQLASEDNNELALAALQLFIKIYGAQAGNLALTVLPKAGLYIAGGIAAKNLQHFKKSTFIDAFNAKGKMKAVIAKIPVRLILQPKVGLIGARLLASKSTV
ncbi:MAG: glucokinase, partial [Proteobacteria bacterium]|nr:glucokinase [Pseudomonadota bacterium]